MSDEAESAPRKGPATIGADVASKLIMVTPQWLNKLERMGYVKKLARGKYTVPDVVQGYIRYLKDEERNSTKTAGDSRVRDARAQEIEMRIEERTNALKIAALEAAMTLFDEAAGGLKADLLSIPARVTKDIPLRRRIEAEINGALDTASKRAEACAKGLGASGGAVAQPAGSSAGRLGPAKSSVRKVKRGSGKART